MSETRQVRLRGLELQLAWGEWLGRLPWEKAITLTFDPKRVFPVGQERAEREAEQWVHQLGWLCRRPVAWVYAAERHANGQWHVHALTVGIHNRPLTVALDGWRCRNGFVECSAILTGPDGHRAALYATKKAAQTGEVVFADTLNRYRGTLSASPTILLYPTTDERSSNA